MNFVNELFRRVMGKLRQPPLVEGVAQIRPGVFRRYYQEGPLKYYFHGDEYTFHNQSEWQHDSIEDLAEPPIFREPLSLDMIPEMAPSDIRFYYNLIDDRKDWHEEEELTEKERTEMRKISLDAALAMRERRHFKRDNTLVDNGEMYLFGHKVAWYGNNGHSNELLFSLCRWNSVTTRDRLNALGIPVRSYMSVPYVGTTRITASRSYVWHPDTQEVEELTGEFDM